VQEHSLARATAQYSKRSSVVITEAIASKKKQENQSSVKSKMPLENRITTKN